MRQHHFDGNPWDPQNKPSPLVQQGDEGTSNEMRVGIMIDDSGEDITLEDTVTRLPMERVPFHGYVHTGGGAALPPAPAIQVLLVLVEPLL